MPPTPTHAIRHQWMEGHSVIYLTAWSFITVAIVMYRVHCNPLQRTSESPEDSVCEPSERTAGEFTAFPLIPKINLLCQAARSLQDDLHCAMSRKDNLWHCLKMPLGKINILEDDG